MKPFNLEEAKAGKPVQLANGTKARIICFDTKRSGDYPITTLVEVGESKYEDCRPYNNNGEAYYKYPGTDLVMAPEEKVFYVNIYPEEDGCIHHSRKTADRAASHGNRIACVKVTYTEGQYDD